MIAYEKADGKGEILVSLTNHNYEPSSHASSHIVHQHFIKEQETVIHAMLESSILIKNILTMFQEEDNNINITTKKLYNSM